VFGKHEPERRYLQEHEKEGVVLKCQSVRRFESVRMLLIKFIIIWVKAATAKYVNHCDT
jgi:hypothetical protein